MRILLLLSESWNNVSAPNNNMTNWFTNFPDAEIWTISGSAEMPNNDCCKDYFLISENEMLKSVLKGNKVGKAYHFDEYPHFDKENTAADSKKSKIKKIFASEIARFVRDCAWRFGKYNIEELKKFITDFNPDIIFSQRMGTVKLARLEKTVCELTDAPIVAYTGDDEYSLQQFSFSPMFWIRRLWVRKWLRKVIPTYKLFYSQSKRQMKEFEELFSVHTKFLVKCGSFDENKIHTLVGTPIELVYAGKLYCNRWKTLGKIADTIRKINKEANSIVLRLNIYTGDSVNKKQNRLLNDGESSIIHGRVPASELQGIFTKSDIILHVESFDLKNRLSTKDSFSTKVMDCLASGCAVMAVCWEGHAAYQYLKEKDAAFIASNDEEIKSQLESIAENPKLILDYAKKAYKCGSENHQRESIQKMIYDDFNEVIKA